MVIADKHRKFELDDIQRLEALIKNHHEIISGRGVRNWKLYVILNFNETNQSSYKLWNPKKVYLWEQFNERGQTLLYVADLVVIVF